MFNLDIVKINESCKEYITITNKLDAEGIEEDQRYDICSELCDLKTWYPLVGEEADELTYGEFTRRSERAYENLKKLNYDVTILEA